MLLLSEINNKDKHSKKNILSNFLIKKTYGIDFVLLNLDQCLIFSYNFPISVSLTRIRKYILNNEIFYIFIVSIS